VRDLDAPYRDPDRAGNGYRLVARFALASRQRQLFYSDGLLNVSVFEQPGHVDWDAMPRADATATVKGHRVHRYSMPIGEAWVFDRGGVVYTVIGDVPGDELMSVALDVSSSPDNAVARAARLMLSPLRW
jgi:hypothetical protein